MDKIIVDLQSAIVTGLGLLSLSEAFTVRRRYVPRVELKALDSLILTVVPKSHPVTQATRGAMQRETSFDIGVQKRVTGTPDEELTQVDSLIGFCEELVSGIDFAMRNLVDGGSKLVELSYDPIVVPENLDEDRVFTGVVSVTYRNIG